MFSLFTPARATTCTPVSCGPTASRSSGSGYVPTPTSLFDLFPEFGGWSDPRTVEVTASDDTSVTLSLDLPGVRAEHLSVDVRDDLLAISGQRGAKPDANAPRFSRTVRLPWRAEADQIDATLDHGVLTLTVRRAEADKPRRVTIRTA